MRKLIFFALLLVSTLSFSQAPQFLNYQGIARDASGNIVTTAIGIKFEILQGSASGTIVYEEINNITPSSAGIFTTAIGSGAASTGTFSAINWANSPYFIRVSIDPAGGTSFSTVGTSQLLSVPYALYAESTKPSTLSISGNSLSINNGNSITLPAGTSYTSGNGISITGNTITNTAPTPTLIPAGISSITGTYPTFTIDVPPPSLNYNTGTQELTLTQGTVITTATITTSSTSVSITGPGVTGSYPNYTITPPSATSITATGSSILVNGTSPSFTIVPQPSLTVLGNQLSIVDGNTVTLPTGTTYTNGVGIGITSGTIITNTAMDQVVNITNGTNVTVNSAYPNFTVNATPSLSIAGNTLSITGGTSVVLPAPPPLTPSTGISINSGTITNTAPNQTVNVSGPGVIGTYPSYTVTSAPATTVFPGNNIVVNGTSPSYTVSSPTYTLNFVNSITGVLSNGINNTSVALPQPTLTVSGTNSNVISAGSNSITIPHYTAGNGLTLAGTAPNYTIGTVSTGTSAGWSTLGNSATNATVNFIGTTDNIPFNIRVNNQRSGRIDHLLGSAFYGYQAGNANTTGTFNVAFGNQTLLNNTNGSYNTALGTNALYFNLTGSNNTANGYQAMYSNSTGTLNTAIGSSALYSNTSGSQNTAAGYYALHDNTSGLSNAAFGWYALNKNTTGSQNTASGEQALYWVNGILNSGHGYGSLQNNTSGNQNTASGALAGYNNTGSGNVFLGYQAGYNETGSNKLYIANSSANPPLIYGDFSAGRVGIGTNSPLNQLHVLSNSSTYIKVESSSATTPHGIMFKNPNREWNIINFAAGSDRISFYDATAGQERFVIDGPTGNVGIGENAPTTKLNLSGVNTSTFINAFSASPETAVRIHNDDLTNNNFSSLIFSARTTAAASFEAAKIVGINVSHTSGSNAGDLVFMTRDPGNLFERMRITSNGNVGIGTTNPTTDLEVNGFTKLGSSSPAIQMLKLNGTTAVGQGGSATLSIPGFVLPSKIISVTVMVQWTASPGDWMQPGYTAAPGYEFNWYINGNNLIVVNKNTNSGSLLSKPIVAVITYEP